MPNNRIPKPGTKPFEQTQLEEVAIRFASWKGIAIGHVRREILNRVSHLLNEETITETDLQQLDRDLQMWKPPY